MEFNDKKSVDGDSRRLIANMLEMTNYEKINESVLSVNKRIGG